MRVKVSDATPLQLDYLVATALGVDPRLDMHSHGRTWTGWWIATPTYERMPRYTEDWAHGGPIIEREKIELIPPRDESDFEWMAVWLHSEDAEAGIQNGPTPLIAAMRCYVASKMGDTVEVSDELA